MSNKKFVTSDLHFDHKNIIKYCPESRGHLKSIDHMNETIISNINSVVGEEDTLYILGDICFSSPDKGVEFLKRINGHKVIVWGNHDKKLRQSTVFETNKGLMGVVDTRDYLEIEHKFNGKIYDICMMHFPIFNHHRAHHGSLHFHGHGHARFADRNTFGEYKRVMDIGVDGNGLVPHDIDDLCSEMSRRDFKFHGHHDGTR